MYSLKLLLFFCGLTLSLSSQAQILPKQFPFVNYTEVGGLFGRVISGTQNNEVVENKTNLTVQTLNGVKLSKRLAVGALVGVDWYNAALSMPVGAGLRLQLTKPSDRNVSVFASADAGYGLNWLNKSSTGYFVKGGLMLNPGIGLRLGKPGSGGLLLTLSYKHQKAQVEKPLRWNEIMRDETRYYNRLVIRLGISI